jgi:hypothetical protein
MIQISLGIMEEQWVIYDRKIVLRLLRVLSSRKDKNHMRCGFFK